MCHNHRMKFRTGLIIGLGVGYVLGSRAGRERYDQLKSVVDSVAGNERVKKVAAVAGKSTEGARNLAGTGLVGVAKDNLPQEGVIPGLACAFVEIELDLETGKYEILDYVGIAECGSVLFPAGLAQQMKGGAVWGMGMAALERHVYDPQNGLPANIGYHQCGIPSYLDVPSVTRTAAVDLPDPQNPFGARGIGEPAMGCSVAALTSAISDALDGHIFGRTPISPDMVVNHVTGRDQSFLPLQTNNF